MVGSKNVFIGNVSYSPVCSHLKSTHAHHRRSVPFPPYTSSSSLWHLVIFTNIFIVISFQSFSISLAKFSPCTSKHFKGVVVFRSYFVLFSFHFVALLCYGCFCRETVVICRFSGWHCIASRVWQSLTLDALQQETRGESWNQFGQLPSQATALQLQICNAAVLWNYFAADFIAARWRVFIVNRVEENANAYISRKHTHSGREIGW